MLGKKKKLSKSDAEYWERVNEFLSDPERQAQASQRRDDLERLLNSPMRWYHKLPYWIIIGLIIFGVCKLFGVP